MFVFFYKHKIVARQHGLDPAWGGGMFETFSAILFLVYSLLISRFTFLFSCRGKEAGINDGSAWGEKGGEEREREGERGLCVIFFAGLGAWGRRL